MPYNSFVMSTLALILLVSACSPSPASENLDMSPDMSAPDINTDIDTPPDMLEPLLDMSISSPDSADSSETPTITASRPVISPDTRFIDVHTHCGNAHPDDPTQCNLSTIWNQLHDVGAHAMILSTEHWALSLNEDILADLQNRIPGYMPPIENNEIYVKTGQQQPSVHAFVSLDCWHDTPYSEDWADACKEDAREWIEQGAYGFKDHAGKLWQSDSDGPDVADAGILAGAFTRAAGLCASAQTNRECVNSQEVIYPVLTPAWREVIRYITEDLKAPVVTHSSTYYGAEAECYDPLTTSTRLCGEMSREHLIDFTQWTEDNLSLSARRRVIIAHMAFAMPGEKFLPRQEDTPQQAAERQEYADNMLAQLRTILDTGVSIETSTTKDFIAMTYRQQPGELGACVIRDLFASYPEQIMLGTDGILSRDYCLAGTYELWQDLIEGDVHTRGEQRSACIGDVATYGLALTKSTIPECAGMLPEDVVSNFLIDNFLHLYED